MKNPPRFALEADLVSAYCDIVEVRNKRIRAAQADGQLMDQPVWTIYHETAGWDLLLVDQAGVQVGIEAKLSLNVKVLTQALPRYGAFEGPDYRAVLVDRVSVQSGLPQLAGRLGITVITLRAEDFPPGRMADAWPDLPNERSAYNLRQWFSWLPGKQCALPAYVPDVTGGKAAPVALTLWKVKAIKLMILLERRGIVTRADMRALDISASRWTDPYNGFLKPDRIRGGYIAGPRTPDLKAQHPTNWAQIEADFEKWAPPGSWLAPAML